MKEDRRLGLDLVQPRVIGVEKILPLLIADEIHGMRDEGRQDIETRIGARTALPRPQDHVDIAEQAVRGAHRRIGCGRGRDQGAASAQSAGVVAFPGAIGDAVCEDAIEPSLEYCRNRKPPQRKLKDQEIAPQEFVDFALDVRLEQIVGLGVLLFAVVLQMFGESPPRKSRSLATGLNSMA